MDKREIKTKRNIKNAFLMLRSKKEIEQITVKEIAEKAEISKATFYLHYKDIYDLSDTLGIEIVENILKDISDPNNVIDAPAVFIRELVTAFIAQRNMIDILFSGSQNYKLIDYISFSIKKLVFELHPEYKENLSFNLQMTYKIKGVYYAFQDNIDKFDTDTLIDELCRLFDT
ncbi:MAG: TetR/AcrR family transcriptional regulator [Roseburia sp.]|nr:TetR/AcrR family transcriptional regulator [Roseburia sp.]